MSIGKASMDILFIPGIFNINEPMIFGAPMMLNPYMFIPFNLRSEERRVGKECRSRWSPYH